MDILDLLKAAVASAGIGFSLSTIFYSWRRVIGSHDWSPQFLKSVIYPSRKQETYSRKLNRLTRELGRASAEVDKTLSEIAEVAVQHQNAVDQLEMELLGLSHKEKELKERVAALESVPLPAVEHFAKLTALGEKRSAWRDYMLFLAGVIVSTAVAIVLNLIGLG